MPPAPAKSMVRALQQAPDRVCATCSRVCAYRACTARIGGRFDDALPITGVTIERGSIAGLLEGRPVTPVGAPAHAESRPSTSRQRATPPVDEFRDATLQPTATSRSGAARCDRRSNAHRAICPPPPGRMWCRRTRTRPVSRSRHVAQPSPEPVVPRNFDTHSSGGLPYGVYDVATNTGRWRWAPTTTRPRSRWRRCARGGTASADAATHMRRSC